MKGSLLEIKSQFPSATWLTTEDTPDHGAHLPPLPWSPGPALCLQPLVGIAGVKGSENCRQEREEGIWLSGVEMAWRGICVIYV